MASMERPELHLPEDRTDVESEDVAVGVRGTRVDAARDLIEPVIRVRIDRDVPVLDDRSRLL